MARPLRIQYEEAVYHVMNRGTGRRPTFIGEVDHGAFLDMLAEAHRIWAIEVFGYCLMRNHYHVCLRTPKGNLARVMRHVDGLYTQRFNRRHRREGALFRGRYRAIVVDRDEYLSAVVRYIHLNPVEAGIVKTPEDYRWSSHWEYLRARGAPKWSLGDQICQQKI
jgi:putative transposase